MQQVRKEEARRLVLRLQLLSGRGFGPLASVVEKLGYVQLDSINVVARAHELILHSRLPAYKLEDWHKLLVKGQVFEHWTHDASIIPMQFMPYWLTRFQREGARIRESSWWRGRLGEQMEDILESVRAQLRERGPLLSKDFQIVPKAPKEPGAEQGWWNWRPEKAALEYLWRTGEIIVAERRNFHKVYRLASEHALAEPTHEQLVDWSCREAVLRLGVATPAQLAAYWRLIPLTDARKWSAEVEEDGQLERVLDPAGRPAIARADWQELPCSPSSALRLLAPFDPILRDRARTELLFDFDFRFEAFVPQAKRQFGYYTLPILEGDRLIGRLTPKL